MVLVIKNKKPRVMNLGTKEGHMLSFNPEEEKTVSDAVATTFEADIVRYVDANLIEVVTKTKSAKLVDNSEKAPVAKKATKKKTTKKKTTRVAKE